MKKTLITMFSAVLLLGGATSTACAQVDEDLRRELDSTREWTTDVQPTWQERVVDWMWESNDSDRDSGSGSGGGDTDM